MRTRRIREAWPAKARKASITTRQQQAALKKTGLFITKATGGQALPDFSGRTGFRSPKGQE